MKNRIFTSRFQCVCSAVAAFLFLPVHAWSEQGGAVQILLLGDSTTEGYVPRQVRPEGPHLDQMLEQLLSVEEDVPPCKVLVSGKGGETIRALIDGGRYQKDVSHLPGLDYIFIRYGINDSAQADFVQQFPQDYQELIGRLRQDHPQAMIVPMTNIPFGNEWGDNRTNDLVKQAASKAELTVFDLYPSYAAAMKNGGMNSFSYRRYPLAKIPQAYHGFLEPWMYQKDVVVLDNELDALFGHLSGWFGDRHQNLAGYNLIAVETAKFLTPLLKTDQQ